MLCFFVLIFIAITFLLGRAKITTLNNFYVRRKIKTEFFAREFRALLEGCKEDAKNCCLMILEIQFQKYIKTCCQFSIMAMPLELGANNSLEE